MRRCIGGDPQGDPVPEGSRRAPMYWRGSTVGPGPLREESRRAPMYWMGSTVGPSTGGVSPCVDVLEGAHDMTRPLSEELRHAPTYWRGSKIVGPSIRGVTSCDMRRYTWGGLHFQRPRAEFGPQPLYCRGFVAHPFTGGDPAATCRPTAGDSQFDTLPEGFRLLSFYWGRFTVRPSLGIIRRGYIPRPSTRGVNFRPPTFCGRREIRNPILDRCDSRVTGGDSQCGPLSGRFERAPPYCRGYTSRPSADSSKKSG